MRLFSAKKYIERRKKLTSSLKEGLILIMGNDEAPMNYTANTYRYRQDSNFLYYFGLNLPNLCATLDVESGEAVLYGNEFTMDDTIWIGPHPSLSDLGAQVGISTIKSPDDLRNTIYNTLSKNRVLHFLPQYRYDNISKISSWAGQHTSWVQSEWSESLVKAVVNQRSYKSEEEISEMEEAVNISGAMHRAAMQYTKHGMKESEIVGEIIKTAKTHGADYLSYMPIVSVHGQTLHNHHHHNIIKDGQLLLNDSGAENSMMYAGDITRTFPVSGKFTTKQKEIYNIVLEMEETGIEMVRPGILYRDIHIRTNLIMLTRLKELGIVTGDPEEMNHLEIGGLFMPHGLGHMIGLDVHDMEDLGEQYVGYRPGLNRDENLGLKSLRLAKELEAGFVLTVEPGIYFIPQLIDKWKAEQKFVDHINYQKLEDYYDFGGVRIEDNVLVTEKGHRELGDHIPKSIEEVEHQMSLD